MNFSNSVLPLSYIINNSTLIKLDREGIIGIIYFLKLSYEFKDFVIFTQALIAIFYINYYLLLN